MIHTRIGRVLLSREYIPMTREEKRKIEREVCALVTARSKHAPNFLAYADYTVATRSYSNLHFTMLVTGGDNELADLEIIHFFVETLDSYFGTVYERNIIDDFQKVQTLLDEVILAGEVQETGKEVVLNQVHALDQYL